MSILSSYKKIFLLGFIIVILTAIPLSVYIAQKRQQTTIRASKSTTLSFEVPSPTTKVGDTLTMNIVLDPGTGTTANQVSFVKLIVNFDAEKFTTVSDSLAYNPNLPNTLTSVLEGPTSTSGTTSISLSIGTDPANVLTTRTKIATLKLKALAPTESAPTKVTFDNSQILSIASSDSTSENVLSTTTPANVTISGSSSSSSTSPTGTPAVTAAPSSSTTTPPPSSSTDTSTENSDPFQITTLDPETIALTETPIIDPLLPQDLSPGAALPPTGPGEQILGIGVIGAIITIIGGAIFFLL